MSNREEEIINLFSSVGMRPKDMPVTGIGDDAAVIPVPGQDSQLITTDLLVSGVHFLLERSDPRDIGYKALAVNVSDIAAMGGEPRQAFLSISIPKKIDPKWISDFVSGFSEAAQEFGISLLGGDTTSSVNELFINVTLLGYVAPEEIKLRSGGKPGDLIAVSGYLGDSYAGLSLVLQDSKNSVSDQDSRYLLTEHYRPRPHVQEGRLLAKNPSVTAMMDLSDGLITDFPKLARASGCGAKIDVTRLPVSEPLRRWCAANNQSEIEWAGIGGEDYKLLFTFEPGAWNELEKHLSFFVIGELVAGSDIHYELKGSAYFFTKKAFTHF